MADFPIANDLDAALRWKRHWEKVSAAVSEGMCPLCGGALEPALYHPLAATYLALGWCGKCRLYHHAGPPGHESGSHLEGIRHAYQRMMGFPIS